MTRKKRRFILHNSWEIF